MKFCFKDFYNINNYADISRFINIYKENAYKNLFFDECDNSLINFQSIKNDFRVHHIRHTYSHNIFLVMDPSIMT